MDIQARTHYADAVLERCYELLAADNSNNASNDDDDDDLTYLCIWLRRPAIYQCSHCHKDFDTFLPFLSYDSDNSEEQQHLCEEDCLEDGDRDRRCPGRPRLLHFLPNDKSLEDLAETWDRKASLDGEFYWHESVISFFPERTAHYLNCCLVPSSGKAAALIQVHKKKRFVTTGGQHALWQYNFDDTPAALVYTKERVWAWIPRKNEEWVTVGTVWDHFNAKNPIMTIIPAAGLNPSINSILSVQKKVYQNLRQHGGSASDVFSLPCHDLVPLVKPLLSEHAKLTNDRPIPRYHNIIDPNLFVRTRKSDGKSVWVPSEFNVSVDGSQVELVGGRRAHWLKHDLINGTATPILQRALPLLAKLRRPCLLLEGQRLQVVIKAQRIELPPKRDEDDISEYVGLWHVDGEHEQVAAVVLFYYHADEALTGGNIEFLDRQPLDILGEGDCANNCLDYHRESLRASLRPTDESDPVIPNCSVPVETGTLLVFSNYQMVHRVLRMLNTSSDRAASRDFMALFILDPASRPLIPARCHLAHSHLYLRTLSAESEDGRCVRLNDNVSQCILEFMGVIPSMEARFSTRVRMLRSQLQPKGHLSGSTAAVCCMGNGCYTMIGWINSMLEDLERNRGVSDHRFEEYHNRTKALNVTPREVGRGLSETLSIPSEELTDVLNLEEYRYRTDDSDASEDSSEEEENIEDRFVPLLPNPGG